MSGLTTASPALTAAFAYCRDICRTRARNFYYGLKLSPEPQRSALFVIYAWMRLADDFVDNAAHADAATIRAGIDEFRSATDRALAGRPISDEPLWLALAAVASRFNLPPKHFHSMLDGQLDDLAKSTYQSFEGLRTYCCRVASTVGLLCIEVWGYQHVSAQQLSIDRGIAFQLTNILRDYKQDFDDGRVYLPLDDFQRHGIDPPTLRKWSNPEACEALVKEQIQRAETHYRRSARLDALITPACLPTLWAMTSIYRELLRKMDEQPARIVSDRRVRLSALQKGTIALRAKWVGRGTRKGSNRPAVVANLSDGGVSGNTSP